ncbi:hypothetical protein JM79_2777 [Gramella sp. Hel_I_59]|uniref:hypothetical protein n=1 Tax=Gramella sp. Hel_I_59 TaxID=1249978 RepID=UPI0011546EFE|nr:hypothetical protein [Gramella sp. Hel_I_59]TQI71828.1 hypothetical protein JM79_2777 [Gramella sp. Hel_I_59]
MDIDWVNHGIGFVLSIGTSIVFILLLLFFLQPRIEISDKICYKTQKGKKFYFFKIVNRSWFSAYTIEFELYKKIPYIVDKVKVNHRIEEIALSRSKFYSIPPYKRTKGYGDHAVLIRTFEDLNKDINVKNQEYILIVSAKHGLFNLTKVTTQTFENSEVFHKGHFKFGKNLGVC